MEPAILVIDMINDFVSGLLGSERAQGIVPKIRSLLHHAREEEIPIIYVSDSHAPNDREFDFWPSHAVEGSWGARVVDEIRPEPGDHIIEKQVYSPFQGTDLDGLLRRLGVDTVILTGLVTNICVQHAAADAYFRGYQIIVPSDCVEAPSDEEQTRALTYMQRMYGAEVTTSTELMGT